MADQSAVPLEHPHPIAKRTLENNYSEERGHKWDCGSVVCLVFSLLLCIVGNIFTLLFAIKIVQEYERAVIFRLGRVVRGGAKGPGLFCIVPCIDRYQKVDMRTISFDIPPQEILTKDSVTVAVDAVVYYRVFNAMMTIINVQNSQESTRLLAQTTLRTILGTHKLSEILSEREVIAAALKEQLDVATDPWGIQVERVELKDVRLPVQLQRAMAAEAEATRDARAKIIAAEGEQQASKSLRDAAEIMMSSPASLQLRYLQTLHAIAADNNSTVIFPLPMEFLTSFQNPTKL